MNDRKEILKKLIEYSSEPSELVKNLSEFGWDSTDALVKLEVKHIVKVLKSYLEGAISKNKIEDWANAIEVREDIEFDEVSKNLIFDLANPELTGQEMNESWAKEIIKKYSSLDW